MGKGKYSLDDYRWNSLIVGVEFQRAGVVYRCVEIHEGKAEWLSDCIECGESYFQSYHQSKFPDVIRCQRCRAARRDT